MMVTPFLFLSFLLLPVALSQLFRDVFIDCGANVKSTFNNLEWLPDNDYISAGTSKNITAHVLVPTLATVRTFPLQNNVFKKFCYEIPVDRTRKYLIRTTYYYGGVNGNVNPPVFDQIVDGTLWSVVNTTDDYFRGDSSYYEGVFMPTGKNLSVCLAANTHTDSDPFISALEVVLLWDQLYNSTDFTAYSLSLVARHSFGYDGPVIGIWKSPDIPMISSIATGNRLEKMHFPNQVYQILLFSGIWNLPPPKVFQTRLARSRPEPLTLFWPPGPVPSDNYSIALYFANDQTASGSSRTIDVTINGVAYYNNLSVIPAGVVVFANPWPLSGITNLTLAPSPGSIAGPLINAGEVFLMLPSGRKTLPRDVIAMINLRKSFQNPPADWHGDPCLPSGYSWTGVTCSEGRRIRIITLHLENNRLGGMIHPSLGNLRNLRELFLQNNNLTGQVPSNLAQKPGLTLRYTPGNPFLHP
ncbi:UNVERIFIED_CONTAM: putative LRR receptor-like serine/threonine-protein kinase [Sesamum calycinum]|uniref:LRR receptor-like serine/threonine-protein kinase n=1 Tax=Sesamum calycinum TaxID=2727403 RepID=A0AAW2QJZ3_9LAMI